MSTTLAGTRSRPRQQLAMRHCLILCAPWLLGGQAGAQPPRIVASDVCVYGGTSGGVVAALQAARMGKRAVIAEPGRHLGGMTAGGLAAVDIGEPRSVGGIARDYFTRLAAGYGKTLAWDQPFKGHGGGPATGGAFAIEPHSAERLFEGMLRDAGVVAHFGARLDSVRKDGARIAELVMEDGTIFRAKMFIDATYEGDLMAKAGVSYTLVREGNARYGETYNGIHYSEKFVPRTDHAKPGPNGRTPSGQGVWDRDLPLDPYVVPGDPKSGLLPLIDPGEPGTPGDPAPGIQAYCYRLCLTTNDNRIPIAPPRDYDPKRYEIVARFIAGCLAIGDDIDLRWFSKFDPLPNGKFDFNTATFGANLPGASWEWPEASCARREAIAKQHEDYHRGLLHFLATDPRVPRKVRDAMGRFGLPRDEFTDNGGWPHQIYVREARRMISDLVMTEHHTFGRQIAPDSVGLGSYGTDVHEIRRIVKEGVVIREGKIATGRDGAPPYPIGYGAIVPKASECENLLVTFALSASHTAFASIRMEPVFMCLSQSAATAACMAMEAGVPVQGVDYPTLEARLLKDGQIIGWEPTAENARTPAPLPVIDLSADTARHVIIARGTERVYQGHPTTLLMPDGKTMFCVWTLNHGGPCGPMKRSDDGGLTWSEPLPVPGNWTTVKNCPAIYRLVDPPGVARLFVFAGQGPDGTMHQSASNDDGTTWGPMRSNGLTCVMPFCTIVPVDGGKRLIGLSNIRRPGEIKDPRSNVVAQSESTDGGLTWSPWRILVDHGDLKPCEPEVVRSPDGKQLLCLLRENVRTEPGHFITSDNEGRTWSALKDLPPGLHGDRHKAVYAPDGRLVVVFRDMGAASPTKSHFVAWVGRYEDIVAGRDGEYKIKLLHSHKGSDCGYPGLAVLPDGTLVATTYVKYRPGPEQNSVVSARFTLAATDKAERSTRADAGFPVKSSAPVPAKIPPPMLLRSAARPQDADGRTYDLVVIGGTPGGIACAVRAAREGLSVLLVNHTRHLGGFMTSGAGGWEAPYDGLRSPLYAEMLTAAAEYYRKTYGEGSPQHIASLPSDTSRAHIDRPKIEPRIAEMLFNQMVGREKKLAILLGHIVASADREGPVLKAVTLKPTHGGATIRVNARIYADAMYEGDLMAAAGVTTQIGREARGQYNEPHAGVIYTKDRHKEPGQRGFPKDADAGRLNIRYNSHATGEIVEGPHSGEADGSVMAYNYRLILTRDPANRVMVEKPANYDVAIAKAAASGGFVPNLPNNKVAWNGGRLVGPQNDYPAGDWPTRERISRQYLDAMLMRLWWMQNGPDAPAADRQKFAGYGLAADEFPDNHHAPYEIYVREARRLIGRYVFKEQDNKVAPSIARTPIHADSIAITDWPVDSVACLPRKAPGSNLDGIVFLGEESRPAQVPYRCLLPQELDNLLVPVALSASHVGWGAIRLEPVWMQTGESAGFAAALAVKNNTTPAQLDPDLLLRKLATSRVMITFFNDVDVSDDDAWIPAAQFFGTKGFFSDYNARPNDPLTEAEREAWQQGFSHLQQGTFDPAKLAAAVHAAAAKESPPTNDRRAIFLLRLWKQLIQP